MKEIAELQSQQKKEIESLYLRLGKPLPPNVGFLHSAPPSGRRRRTSKHKLKTGKLLNPVIQQLKTSSTSMFKSDIFLSTYIQRKFQIVDYFLRILFLFFAVVLFNQRKGGKDL